MKPSLFAPIAAAIPAALLLPAPTLLAQEVVDVTGRDRHLEPGFEEVYRVGALDGETWEMFASVPEVGFDDAGNLYVFDRSGGDSRDARIVVFDRTGAFLREFGSAGEGPGEFKRASDMAIMRDGTTIVLDSGHDAYQIFDPSAGVAGGPPSPAALQRRARAFPSPSPSSCPSAPSFPKSPSSAASPPPGRAVCGCSAAARNRRATARSTS